MTEQRIVSIEDFMAGNRVLMYHPESDSLFEMRESDLPDLMETMDGALCANVTGDPEFEARFIFELRVKP